jgi:prephenate dehydratase
VVQHKKINLSHIESRPSKVAHGYEILVECDENSDRAAIEDIILLCKKRAATVRVQDFNTQVKQNNGRFFIDLY